MPSDTRQVLAASARFSPSARLYSAVPRSSQCPSMVITHVGYFLRMPALVLSACCDAPSTSKLSSGKNTGWNGEFLLMTSRSPPTSGSSLMVGSGGTGVRSGTGVGGAGGGLPGVVVVLGGGGSGLETGGFFLPHAPAPSARMSIAITANCVCLISLSLKSAVSSELSAFSL